MKKLLFVLSGLVMVLSIAGFGFAGGTKEKPSEVQKEKAVEADRKCQRNIQESISSIYSWPPEMYPENTFKGNS